ncbi:MAG: HD domain-containing protein, partial [Muribaculaceae bacterium]|nr:HD domain-containing protein [Muribaculaceae bacterium]
MPDKYLNETEATLLPKLYAEVIRHNRNIISADEISRLRKTIAQSVKEGHYQRDKYGINPLIHNLQTMQALAESLSPDREMGIAIMLRTTVVSGFFSVEKIAETWGDDIAHIVNGLIKVSSLYSHRAAVESDNFRRLLMTFADDIRVIILMIVDRLVLMRRINHHPDEQFVRDVAYEANYLYAPLAHRLGLYYIKSQLEDMSLKYSNREVYNEIAGKLNETKAARDEYIAQFIAPVKEKLTAAGLNFDIKGRTKSIYSIWNKMKKQHNDIEHIYDLFAIRIIIDTPPEKEKSDCWFAYSVITDMYTPNTSRLKDWISIPKSNGYESLHITVNGPDNRWVEVQIRTRRMDLVAEKGLAAHWRYKGIQSESNLDNWMNNIRDILEAAETGPLQLIKNFKMDIYSKEVFVFTPKGDLYKLPAGASLLDFAFHIHSKLGCICTGGKVNGKNQKINYRLQSGDTVEILTSSQQSPKLDWLNFIVTSKARNKIKQAINERSNRDSELARELLQRRFKNRKIEIDEAIMMKLIKKLGYKTVTQFYSAVNAGELSPADVIERYLELKSTSETQVGQTVSADEFELQSEEKKTPSSDI